MEEKDCISFLENVNTSDEKRRNILKNVVGELYKEDPDFSELRYFTRPSIEIVNEEANKIIFDLKCL